MKRLTVILSIITVFVVIFLFVPLFKVFSFTETRTNNPQLYYINVSKDDEFFQIRFTHSIHLTDVLETYKLTNSTQLKLLSMEYEDVGVGMPAYAEEDQTLIYKDGKYILSYKDKVIDNFTLYIGNVEYDLFFRYNDEEYDLKKSLEQGKSYFFEVKKVSLYEKLKGVLMTNE